MQKEGCLKPAALYYLRAKMKSNISILIMLALFLVPAGCMSKNIDTEKVNAQINVFGVKLFSDVDYKEINGVTASEEPCLKGYERSFDALDIVIGYGFNKRIRKITTRNPNTSIFSIKPGMAFEEGKQEILIAGFTEDIPPFIFSTNGCTLTFLVDGNNKIFGLTFQTID
jgi:hypothetical protein